jgi:hypothetical protein
MFVRSSLLGLGLALSAQPLFAQQPPTSVKPAAPQVETATQAESPPAADAPAVVEGAWTPSAAWHRQGHAPGGDFIDGARVGLPYYYNAPGYLSVGDYGGTFGYTGYGWIGYRGWDPYVYHFGPGIHRHTNYGHYRFPFHTYRAPWYFKGAPSYNRDTNHPW